MLRASAVQSAAATKDGYCEVYQVQCNFCGDWQLYSAIVDLLETKKVGFSNGSKLTPTKQLVGTLADVLYEIRPAEC